MVMAPSINANNGSSQPQLTLSNGTMLKLKPSRIFKTAVENPTVSPGRPSFGPRHITGICFDDRGDQLLTAAEDETFRLYNCKSGKHLKTLQSKKYGIDLPRFTHKSTAIIHASTKEDDGIRYHSLHDNKYLSYFKGHKGRVISLEVSPVDDGFMSGSLDKTVRLWDLRAPNCRGLLTLPAPPVIAYDASGLVFAVAVNHYSRILLYDQANYDKAPFLVITLEDLTLTLISYPPRPIYMTSLSFSSNGKYLLVGCSGDAHYILDAFGGHLIAKLEGHVGLERRSVAAALTIQPDKGCSGEEVSWTPDSKFIVGGSLDGKVLVWDVQDLQVPQGPVNLKTAPRQIYPLIAHDGHPGISRCVKFNPRHGMMATAGAELAFWLPDTAPESEEVARDLLKRKAAA
ncbi:WD40-repeat-containing domain protein [Lentinula edodes]|uniref:WD40-repeat-containing domain protein n=1 Tax=Lentinula edodes TaxID=5353 RepID=UPI001E8DC052|nr:WD40-repeat-containing domain protein [Lentinula edodes]KAH7873431.1 WD40-repeat-containing domain protein [Lentinula edodes]